MTDIVSLEALASALKSGQSLAVPADYSGIAMAATAAIVDAGIDDLRLVCVPVSGMQADILIGSGRVRRLETSAVTLGEAGGAPRFGAAVRAGAIELRDATCPAIHAGLLAAQKGVPFMPIAGIIGSDLMRVRPDWMLIDNPFAKGEQIVVVPAIRPDVALFHAPEADRQGNIRIGRRRELAAMAYAAERTFVTVERITDKNLLETEDSAAGVLPALYVDKIAVAPRGAWPLPLWGEYAGDDAEVRALRIHGAHRRGLCGLRERISGPPRESRVIMSPEIQRREIMIAAIADLLEGVRHVAVGASSPIPASGAMLLRARNERDGKPPVRISVLGSQANNFFTNGGVELFDCAAQGRVDAFFLGGGQIDGAGNINLVGAGDYPRNDVRWPGSFGSRLSLLPRAARHPFSRGTFTARFRRQGGFRQRARHKSWHGASRRPARSADGHGALRFRQGTRALLPAFCSSRIFRAGCESEYGLRLRRAG